MMFGWYYDGCTVQDEDADVWALIGRAVPEAADDERLHALLVGEMVACAVAELIDEEDVVSMSNDGRLTADEIVEVVSERHGERVYDGHACLDSGEAKPALRRIVQRHRCAEDAAAEIVQWAREHITLDPPVACHGRRPIPIEYIEGEWAFGGTENEPAAVITYATEESMETGHVGWCWWALGKMGDAPTLEEAKRRAETVLRRIVDAPPAPGPDAYSASADYKRSINDAPGPDARGACGDDPLPVCPGCHAVGEERCAPGCIDAEIEAEHRHAIESGDYDDPEPGEYDDDEIIARGSIPPYVACGMWLEDEESRTGEWFVRDIFDVDDGCMALMERAGCEPFHMHTSELRKHWRLARDYDPNAEVT